MRVLLLLTACSCSALQTLSLQALTPAVQQAIAQRATLQTLHDAASGAALWRQCFLEGRVPDETLDDVSWPDEPTRAACLVAFDPVARVVGRHPRLADLALLALIDAATSSDEEDLEPLAPTVAAVTVGAHSAASSSFTAAALGAGSSNALPPIRSQRPTISPVTSCHSPSLVPK